MSKAKTTKSGKCRARIGNDYLDSGKLNCTRCFMAPAANNGLPELRAFCATLSEEAKDEIAARFDRAWSTLRTAQAAVEYIGIKPSARK
jgi:hypothetical protein